MHYIPIDLLGGFLQDSAEQREQLFSVGLPPGVPPHRFHLVVPVEQVHELVVSLLAQALNGVAQGPLVVSQDCFGNSVDALKKVLEEQVEVV